MSDNRIKHWHSKVSQCKTMTELGELARAMRRDELYQEEVLARECEASRQKARDRARIKRIREYPDEADMDDVTFLLTQCEVIP